MDGNEIKLEPSKLRGTVKLEPLDHDYSENPKLEETDYFKKSEESPIFEYPDYLKLESVDHDVSAEPIQAQSKKSTVRKCRVCHLTKNNEYITTTKLKYRKIIVLLGAFLNGKISISWAKSSLDTALLATCSDHIPEAVNEIFKVLEIQHIDEMHSKDNQQKLMDTINSFSSEISFPELHKALDYYFRKDGSLRELIGKPTSQSSSKRLTTRVCAVCSSKEYSQNLIHTESKFRQLILMIGCVLGEVKTVKEAQLLITKSRFYTCKSHSSEAVNEIFRVLNIKKVEEMQSCSIANIEILMQTVNLLCSNLKFSDFQSRLDNFVRNESINC